MPKLLLRPGLCPEPHWGSLQRSPDSLAGLRGPTSKGRGNGRERTEEGKKREGDSREGDGTGKLRPLPFSNSWIRPGPMTRSFYVIHVQHT